MRALKYFVTEAAASLWRGRRSAILAILTIGAGLFVLGFFLIVNTNVRRLTERWGESAEFAVYLRDDITAPQLEAVQSLIDSSGLSAARQYVSKEQAAQRFGKDFPDLGATAGKLSRNPFPASVDVRLRPEVRAAEEVVDTPAQRCDYLRAIDRAGHRGAARPGLGADGRECGTAGRPRAP
jgi:cell division transport system permease protein